MIAIDTNILLRVFLKDDPAQSRAALSLLRQRSETDPAFVSREVVVEFFWVLLRRYRMPREGIALAVDTLLTMPAVRFEAEDAVRVALTAFRETQTDFADLMIRAAAGQAGCRTVFTFDRRFAGEDGVTLLEAS